MCSPRFQLIALGEQEAQGDTGAERLGTDQRRAGLNARVNNGGSCP